MAKRLKKSWKSPLLKKGFVSEAEIARKQWPRLTELRRDSLEEAFGENLPDVVTIYHAGPIAIHPGVFVTTDPYYAREFLEEGERVWTKTNIPLRDLKAWGDGRVMGINRHTKSKAPEFIYDPEGQ